MYRKYEAVLRMARKLEEVKNSILLQKVDL